MENKNNIKNKNIETYAEDMAKVISGGEGGNVRKMILAQEELESGGPVSLLQNKKNKYFIFFSILLVILSFASLYFLFSYRKENSVISVEQRFVPIIYLDDTDFVEVGGLTKDQISQNILNKVSSKEIKQGGVMGIYLTVDKQILGLRKFFTLISANIDQKQLTFVNDNFLIGAANTGSKNLFMLLKVRSTADIFDIVHSWENKMFYDLHGFFGVNLTADTKYLLTKNFEDVFIQNKNARVLRDNDGNIVVMYVFSDDTSLIIANNESSVREVMLRLSSSIIRK